MCAVSLFKKKDPPKPPDKLYAFQRIGIDYLLDKKRAILADDMGLGKTYQTLKAIDEADAYPAIVITPASLKKNWSDIEIPKWLPHKRICVATKDTGFFELQWADIIVTNFEQLTDRRKAGAHETTWTDVTKKNVILSAMAESLKRLEAKAIVIDEAHSIKSAKSSRTRACMELRHNIPYRFLLTGTPVLNRPQELVQLLRFLDKIEEFGGSWHFLKRYCGLAKGKFGWEAKGSHRAKELHSLLKRSCFIRRLKHEVLDELPSKTRLSYFIDLSNREEYNDAERHIIRWIRDRVHRDQEFLTELDGLSEDDKKRAIENRKTDKEWKARNAIAMVKISALRRLVAEGKIEASIKWIRDFLADNEDEHLVVFAIHKTVLRALIDSFPDACTITADQSHDERHNNLKKFQNGGHRLLIGAMGTSAQSSPAGVGITLTRASHVAFLELGWQPGHHDQAEDRCLRIGQKKNVTCHYLLGDKTIDLKLSKVLEEKRKVVHQIMDGKDAIGNSILSEVMSSFTEE